MSLGEKKAQLFFISPHNSFVTAKSFLLIPTYFWTQFQSARRNWGDFKDPFIRLTHDRRHCSRCKRITFKEKIPLEEIPVRVLKFWSACPTLVAGR